MGQILHGSATTTHAVRAAIQRSKAPLKELAALAMALSSVGVIGNALRLRAVKLWGRASLWFLNINQAGRWFSRSRRKAARRVAESCPPLTRENAAAEILTATLAWTGWTGLEWRTAGSGNDRRRS